MNKIIIMVLLLVATVSSAKIKQSLGVDQSVDYVSLEKLGPWDDRNYMLTQQDIDVLPKDDHYLANVPLFYKIILRKENPDYGFYYPRSALQLFQIEYGGILSDGIWKKEGLGIGYHPNESYGQPSAEAVRATAENEVPLQLGVFGNEVSVECNPVNKNNCVAGSNGNGGQRMYYSSDSGASWTLSQVNPSSCCDPTIDWSSDGSIVYQADLASNAAVRWSRSLDQGQTWENMQSQTAGGRDKEFIHVDRSPTSPYKDNVYLTWHQGNTMKFTRSLDKGLTMETTRSFGGSPRGIGSDITTDPMGNVYYFYPNFNGAVMMLKSIDGGASFVDNGVSIASLNGSFEIPVPAMETRNVFMYTSADVDQNSGDIYVAWTDETDDSGNSTATNHAWIRVSKSSDQGATWQSCAIPHDATDTVAGGSPIDRFHPWVKVAENGVVHIGYYDTRHSANRRGVDFFYTNSSDGCSSWEPEERYTTVTSNNINNGQEWGDYNGLSVVMDRIVMSFTDNRANQSAMIASGPNPKTSVGFIASASPQDIGVCTDGSYQTTISVEGIQGYQQDVDLSFTNVPSFVENEMLNGNTITVPGTSDVTFDVITGGTPGVELLSIEVEGMETAGIDFLYYSGFELNNVGGPTISEQIDLSLNYSVAVPGVTTLTAPMDMSTDVSGSGVLYSWDAVADATGYTLEIATDMMFTEIIETANVITNSHTATVGLPTNSTVYWRVITNNACGAGEMSTVFTFSTNSELCFTTATPIPDNNAAGVDVILSVVDMGSIASLTASFKATHSWPGDLIVTLSHLGTDVILMNRVGPGANGCNQADVDIIFDDESATPIDGVCQGPAPGVEGTAAPTEPLAGFNQAELAGDWTINVSDNAGQDTGSITEFCIIPVLEVF